MHSIRVLCLFVVGMVMLCSSFFVLANNADTSEQEIRVTGMSAPVLMEKENPSIINMVLTRRAAIDDAYIELIDIVYGTNAVGEKKFMKQGVNDNSDLYFVVEKRIYDNLDEDLYAYIDDVFAKKLALSRATKIVDEGMDKDGVYFISMVFYIDKFNPSVYVETKPQLSGVYGQGNENSKREEILHRRYVPFFIKNKRN